MEKKENFPFGKLDATDPKDIAEMERQLKEKYEASQKEKASDEKTA